MTVAVLGAGNWGRNHVRTLHAMGALALVAEPHALTREKVQAEFPGVRVVATMEEAFKSDAKGVVIATPVATHHDVALAAIAAGKDVLVEKPMTLGAAEAEQIAKAAAAGGRVLMVGHLLLYQPAVAFIRKALADGIVGKVLTLHQERLNLGRVRTIENALWSLGVHDVAVLLSLVGSAPTGVAAYGHRMLQPEVEDEVHVHLAFEGGVHAYLHVSWLWPERRRCLTIVGTGGMLVYDEIAGTVTRHDKTVDASLAHFDKGQEIVFRGTGDEPLRLELEHFLARIQDRGTPASDGWQGVEVVRVLEQATKEMVVR